MANNPKDKADVTKLLSALSAGINDDSLSASKAKETLQLLLDSLKPHSLDNYKPYLLSLDEQLLQIREYNDLYWGRVFSDARLSSVNTSSRHPQAVDNLEVLHVDFGKPHRTIQYWLKIFAATQPNFGHEFEYWLNENTIRLSEWTRTRRYGIGIHRVAIDLTTHWEVKRPPHGYCITDIWRTRGETFANGEVLSAYGLHPELARHVDGKQLPYPLMIGYELSNPARGPWSCVPSLKNIGPPHDPQVVLKSDTVIHSQKHTNISVPTVR